MRMNCSSTFEEQTYASYLQRAGYVTAYFGKYLNPPAMEPYCLNLGTPIPGWDEMLGMCNTAYFNVRWVDSVGKLVHTGEAAAEYTTSIIGDRTVDSPSPSPSRLIRTPSPSLSLSFGLNPILTLPREPDRGLH